MKHRGESITAAAEAAFSRLRAGQSLLLLGSLPEVSPRDLGLVRVRADGVVSSIGPIDDATTRLARALGHEAMRFLARRRTAVDLRRRILGDTPAEGPEHDLAAVAHRAAQAGRPFALVFEGVEAADRATIASLARIVGRRGFVPLPVALVYQRPPEGAASDLLVLARASWGEEAVVESDVSRARAGHAVADDERVTIDLDTLPEDALRVLRGVSILGVPFDVALLGRLLDASTTEVLQALQSCADHGVPVLEREGELEVPLPLVDAASASLLPALRRHYLRRAAELLTEKRSEPLRPPPPAPEAAPRVASQPASAVDPSALFETEHPKPTMPPASPAQSYRPPSPAEILASAPEELREDRMDAGRAAQHLADAGDVDAAVSRYVEAAADLSSRGDGRRALLLLDRARSLLEGRGARGEDTDELAARIAIETARVLWHGAGVGPEFTLEAARDLAREAEAKAGEDPPPDLAADIAVVLAGIAYDIGDVASLDEALSRLSATSRALLDGGEPTRAARLLNDQAAIHLRAGDPVQAMHLLTRSRDLFETLLRNDPDDEIARIEVAETDHLIARVSLHARLRPGKEADALTLSLDHAIAAERAFRKLGRPLDVARVLETMGRLETKRGRLDRADEALGASLAISKELGDVTGLARTTAAMSDVLVEAGRIADALSLLADSIELNRHKGSPLGLGFNRRALEAIASRARDVEPTDALEARLGEAQALLVRAEEELGGVALPSF